MKRVFLALFTALSFATLPALAEPTSDLERAKESFKAGATAYAAGDYLAAIQALEAAYQLTPLPAIAFSLGQAERRQYFVDHAPSHLERAVALFRQYVEVAKTGSRRADALDALSQLEPLAAAQAVPKPSLATPERSERRTRVLISSDAPNARIALDGAKAVSSPLIREVEPGKHRVHVEAPGFYGADREVIAVASELMPSQVPLRERPSTVSIWCPAASEIYVDGVFVSEGGEGITLQLSSGKHHLAVARNGFRVNAQDLTLERGKARTLRIVLEPTSQRVVSQALFIGGGAALGASLVFSAFAIQAEGRAEDFLGERKYRNVSSAELYRYQSSILDRDRYRLATATCLAASVGFFITGLFLHELDAPNPLQLYRSSPRPGRFASGRTEERAARLQFVPVVTTAQFGASIGGSF